MANVLLVCGSSTSSYSFSYSLTWSSNCEIGELLSDIPFISVGILVFGISVLFLAIKRVPFGLALFFCLLAFIAAILDLGRTLANEMAMGNSSMTTRQIIIARETFFAFSIGLRFLFYWSYVAEPPRDAPPAPEGTGKSFLTLIFGSSNEIHGGSWARWGRPGKLLRSGLLVAIAAITVLEILWRTVPQLHGYTSVYAADTGFQLVVSVLLLLKLLSNTITPNSPDSLLTHTFRECLAPICGLFISIALGSGIYFAVSVASLVAFTESTVGRLLQAFEVYIVALFVVFIALLRYRNSLILIHTPAKSREPNTISLPETFRGSTFRVTPPVVETPRISMVFGTATATASKEKMTDALYLSARRSLSRQMKTTKANSGDDAKPRMDKFTHHYTAFADSRASLASLNEESKEWAEITRDAEASNMDETILRALDAYSAARSLGEIHYDSSPYFSCSGFSHETISAALLVHLRSDGSLLGRIFYGSRTSWKRASRTLKQFSKRTSANSTPDSGETIRHSCSTGRTTVSEASLSKFPVPPRLSLPAPSVPSPRTPPIHTSLAFPAPLTLTASQTLRSRGDSEHLSAAAGRSHRGSSGGTQYNVTSFIKASPAAGEGSSERPWQSIESDINLTTIINGTDSKETTLLVARAEGLPALPAEAKLSPLRMSAGLRQGDDTSVDEPTQQFNSQVVPSVTVTPPSQTHLQTRTSENGAQKHVPITPRVAPEISSSSPSPSPSDGMSNQAPRAFERPRPPPLVL
ncbi:hypothetical protein BU15DRAFT_73763 [Melanogaster broomeanus]|nr:hypothetical protein BU15DRAFT_73763 [Melanogaster broomeanus]